MGNCFWYYLRQLFIFLPFGKCEKDCTMLKTISDTRFCPLKAEIARSPIRFRLGIFSNLSKRPVFHNLHNFLP